MTPMPYGFRIRGAVNDRSNLVDHAAAFAAYCVCDERASVQAESYLSAFRFGEDFRRHLNETGSRKGFAGDCWADWLPFDLDNADDLDAALADAVKLVAGLTERYGIDSESLLLFFSGRKGFGIGLPTSLWNPQPSIDFHRVACRFAEQAAARLAVKIDPSIYSIVQPLRAPNSRHAKSGLHKRRLTFDEMTGLTVAGILDLAREPVPFDSPAPPPANATAAADWEAAAATVMGEAEGKAKLRADANGTPTLNRRTEEFIRGGASEGNRHRLLFSAAANLAEFICPSALAHAILTPPALECGLSPSDIRRQIDCGLAHSSRGGLALLADAPPATETPIPSACPPPDKSQLAALWGTTSLIIPADAGDAWEPPSEWLAAHPERLEFGFGANSTGPYGREAGRR